MYYTIICYALHYYMLCITLLYVMYYTIICNVLDYYMLCITLLYVMYYNIICNVEMLLNLLQHLVIGNVISYHLVL